MLYAINIVPLLRLKTLSLSCIDQSITPFLVIIWVYILQGIICLGHIYIFVIYVYHRTCSFLGQLATLVERRLQIWLSVITFLLFVLLLHLSTRILKHWQDMLIYLLTVWCKNCCLFLLLHLPLHPVKVLLTVFNNLVNVLMMFLCPLEVVIEVNVILIMLLMILFLTSKVFLPTDW